MSGPYEMSTPGEDGARMNRQERRASAPAAPAVDGTPAQISYNTIPVFMTEEISRVVHVMTWRSANGIRCQYSPTLNHITRLRAYIYVLVYSIIILHFI
eukprot:6212018-Pleurochrysis_carterae.AAC.1